MFVLGVLFQCRILFGKNECLYVLLLVIMSITINVCVRNEEVLLLSSGSQCNLRWFVGMCLVLLSTLYMSVTFALALRSSRGVQFKFLRSEVTLISCCIYC